MWMCEQDVRSGVSQQVLYTFSYVPPRYISDDSAGTTVADIARGEGLAHVRDTAPAPREITRLVQAAAAGDRDAWGALVGRYIGLVWSVARGFRLTDADAADVVQTTWLRLVEQLGRIRNPEAVGAWLATTARHEALRILGRARRTVPTDSDRLPELRDADASPGVDDALLRNERDALLWAAFEQLSEGCQTLLRVLVSDPPPSYEEVSAALDMPIGSIGPTRGRCIERLRTLMAHMDNDDRARPGAS
jgi:RNA polymerase sigma factor (sigma-70 family)